MPSSGHLTRRCLLTAGAAFALARPTAAHLALPASTPQDFGAKGDGTTDDSDAVRLWLDHIIENALTGYVPPGDYLLGRLVEKTLKGIARFGITGAGSQVSRFIVPASNDGGAFDIDGFSSRRHEVSLAGFSMIVSGSAQIGFRLKLAEGGGLHQRTITMTDVWARSADKRLDHFVTAFDLTGCWRPRLQNCGWDGPFVQVTDADDSPRFFCETGFNLDGCYGLSIEDCYAWGCVTGVQTRQFVGQITTFVPNEDGTTHVTLGNGPMPFSNTARVKISGSRLYAGVYRIKPVSKTSFDIDTPFAGTDTGRCSLFLGPEGMNFKDNTINGVKNGIWVERPNGREPTCWINGNHINYRDAGIILDGVKIVQMDQNNTYNEDLDQTFSGVPVDIDLRNTSEYIIGAHVFHFDGHRERIGIFVESDTPGEGDNGLIHNCIFSGRFETGIHLSRNVSGVRVGPNLFPGKLKTRVRDLNGSNILL